MDNLTHSLAGAVLGQIGLKRKTGLAMPALIIGANLPDIDAVATIYGIESLAMRRGLTHGPIALALLPLLLAGALLLYDRLKPNPQRLPVHRGWLLALAYLGTLSHPALDWMNSYGIRLLEPYSSQWVYGDTLFIIDVWIWAALIAGVWLSARRERRGDLRWRAPAIAAFFAICLYIFANGLITGRAEREGRALLADRASDGPVMVVANPVPVTFWRRDLMWRDALVYGQGRFSLMEGATLGPDYRPHYARDPRLAEASARDAAVRAFLFWSRMPVARFEGERLILNDQRFGNPLVSNRFQVEARLP